MKIIFKTQNLSLSATLNETSTAKELYSKLPLESKINTWGNEIYFDISPLNQLENITSDVNVGDIAYWEAGNSLCVFFRENSYEP